MNRERTIFLTWHFTRFYWNMFQINEHQNIVFTHFVTIFLFESFTGSRSRDGISLNDLTVQKWLEMVKLWSVTGWKVVGFWLDNCQILTSDRRRIINVKTTLSNLNIFPTVIRRRNLT